MINVQLGGATWGKVRRIDRIRLLNERLVVLLHRLLARCVALGTSGTTTLRWGSLEGSAGGTRGDVELAFEVLNFQPERKILFTKVVP